MEHIPLDEGLDIRALQTTGSVFKINETYDESDYDIELPDHFHQQVGDRKPIDFLGEPVKSFNVLSNSIRMKNIDPDNLVKKILLENGGGLPLHNGCTVSIAFSGYWENEAEPFDCISLNKPMEVDLNDSSLLPGLDMAIRSMLVGEVSVFLLSYKVMYGEMGIPPRIKPKSDCVFYIKIVRSVLTSKNGKINFSEPNMFERIHHEVKLLYSSALQFNKTRNYTFAISLFNKAANMLHKCRLANEKEQQTQEKLLIKLYINLAICYNKINKPLKACSACNELNRLGSLFNNGKALFQNAKAFRMIGVFDVAEKRLKRAMKLCPESVEMKLELDLLQKTYKSCNQSKLICTNMALRNSISDEFRENVELLISNFQQNDNLCNLTLPTGLNTLEIEYIKKVCLREKLYFNVMPKAANKDHNIENSETQNGSEANKYLLDKENKDYSEIMLDDFLFDNLDCD